MPGASPHREGDRLPTVVTQIDRYALDAPDSVESSINTLAAYLCKPSRDDRERAKAIYIWVTSHIAYDTDALRSGNYRDTSASAVLQNRKAVCSGYANLYKALADSAGLNAIVITGTARSKDMINMIGGTPDSNHAWNAVNIQGQWELLDATWGAGYVQNGRFVREYDDFYFFTSPESLIYTHYPDDQQWQLLLSKVSRKAFDSLPLVKPNFFRYGIRLISHPGGVISMADKESITIETRVGADIIAKLEDKDGGDIDGFAVVQRNGNNYLIRLRTPDAGKYYLTLYSRETNTNKQNSMYQDIITYNVQSSSGNKDFIMPKTYGAYSSSQAQIIQPWRRNLKVGTQVKFVIAIPKAKQVSIVTSDNKWISMNRQPDGTFSVQTTIGYNKYSVCVNMDGNGTQYETLVEYQGVM